MLISEMVAEEAEIVSTDNPMSGQSFPRLKIYNLLRRRFFICPAFEIYGGTSGLFDLGPPGAALKAAVELLWRKHFIIHDDMLEITGTTLTPYRVLKVSGHVDRFTDLLVRDLTTQEAFRADHYLEDVLEGKVALVTPLKVNLSKERRESILRVTGSLSKEELGDLYKELGIKSPSGHELSEPYHFNLMFQTEIGASGKSREDAASNAAFLRPETAQGIFVNFRRLYEYNGGKMPFATAQLGISYRNEIAPRNGLLRVREFPMAEIEHFVHKDHKQHANFHSVEDLKLPLYPRANQVEGSGVITNMSLREAVGVKMIDNETLAYYLGRTFLFFLKCGLQLKGIRFRQHLSNEMAHYASDCWDAEVLCSYGWIEVAGHADRSAYDLSSHSNDSKVDLTAYLKYEEPITKAFVKYVPDKPLIGKTFKKDQVLVNQLLEEKSDSEKLKIEATLEQTGVYELKDCTGKTFCITREMVKFVPASKVVSEETYIPNVIEPSFGVGRLLYCILEHTFRSRDVVDQEERNFFALPPIVAPTKCAILPISNNKLFLPISEKLHAALLQKDLSCKVDASGATIGKRYARTDEIGVPFAVTIDFQTLQDDTVTIRERNSMNQIRISTADAPGTIEALVQGWMTWEDVAKAFPLFVEQAILNE